MTGVLVKQWLVDHVQSPYLDLLRPERFPLRGLVEA
jgi:hypothetical protein